MQVASFCNASKCQPRLREAVVPSIAPAVARCPDKPACMCGQVFINVSPIEYGHVLLVPRALDRLQQLVDPASLRLALHFAREAGNPYFRLAFNSLGAYGTVNHLHFQVREQLPPPCAGVLPQRMFPWDF